MHTEIHRFDKIPLKIVPFQSIDRIAIVLMIAHLLGSIFVFQIKENVNIIQLNICGAQIRKLKMRKEKKSKFALTSDE